MILKLLKFTARRVHNVKVQLLMATFYGLLDIYGFGGTVAIILKIRKQAERVQWKNKKSNAPANSQTGNVAIQRLKSEEIPTDAARNVD
jgi:hypothetical protein